MTQAPFLELVICTYNNAGLLEQVLDAIAQQQVPSSSNWGVLIVNNNCTDTTETIVNRAIQAGQIPQLRMVNEPRQGLTPARLCGIQHTTAPWVAFIDDDCVLQPDWVAEAIAFATQHPTCGGFGGRVTLAWQTPPPPYVLDFTYSFAEQNHGDAVQPVDCLVGAGMVINRAALVAVGWTEHQFLADRIGKQLVSGGDVEIGLRLAAHYDLWYVPACEILHQIPNHRTTYPYLLRINYGLGTGKLLSDALCWEKSYLTWIGASLQQIWLNMRYAVFLGLQASLQGTSLRPAAITFTFWRGYGISLWQVIWMPSGERERLLGGFTKLSSTHLPAPLSQESALCQ